MKTPEEHGRSVGTALILIAFLLIFTLIWLWMHSVGLLVLPEPIAELLSISDGGDDSTVSWDTGELYSMLREGAYEQSSEVSFDLTYENLRLALLTESEPEGYCHDALVSYYSNGKPKSERVRLFVRGENFRVERYSGTTLFSLNRLAVADASHVTWYELPSNIGRSVGRSDDILPENEAGFPSVEELMAIIAEFPTGGKAPAEVSESIVTDSYGDGLELHAETEELPRYTDCRLAMIEANGTNVYLINFFDELLGLREEYLLSLEHRAILLHNTYSDGELIFSFETISFSVDPKLWSPDSLYIPG